MTLFSSSRISVGAMLLVVAAGTLVHAQQEWTGATDNDWTNAGNWDGGVPGSGGVAIFDNAGNGNTNIALGGATQPVNGLYFDMGSAAYTIGQQTGDTLDFDSAGTVTVADAVTTSQTINAAVNVNGAGMLVNNNVNNGGALIGTGTIGLTFGDVKINSGVFSITNGADLGSGGLPTTATALNGDITGDGALNLFAPTGGGSADTTNNNFLINGNNTYTGGTLLQVNTGSQGSIQIGTDSPFGSGKVHNVFQGNSIEFRAMGGTRTISNDFDLDGGMNFAGSNTIIMDGDIAVASGTTRTLFNKITASGAELMLGATPGSNVIYLGNPTSNGGDGSGRIVILQATSGSTMVVNSVFQDVDSGSAVRIGSQNGGHIIINAPQTYTSETQIGSGEATVEFHQDYNAGDPSGPFGLGTLHSNGGSNARLAPTGGDRTIANPIQMDFGIALANVSGDNSSVTFTGPITYSSATGGSAGYRVVNNVMPGAGGTVTLGSADTPSTITLAAGNGVGLNFTGSGKTVVNDTIQDSAPDVNNPLIVTDSSTTTFNGPQITDGNFLVTGNNSTVIINGPRTSAGGSTPGNITMTGTSAKLFVNSSMTGLGTVIVTAGTLAGTGSLDAPVTNNGTIAPGDQTLTPGTLTLNDDLTNGADSHWLIGLDGSTSGKLIIGGDLNLSAVDNLDVMGSGTGPWVIATYGGMLMGTFDNVTDGYTVDYDTPGEIILNTSATLSGDYNGDGKVDAADYVVWRKHLGDLDETALNGNGDNMNGVDQGDYTLWRSNFGNPSGSGAALSSSAAVPEPASMLLLLAAIVVLPVRRAAGI